MPEKDKMVLIVTMDGDNILTEKFGADLMNEFTSKVIGDLHKNLENPNNHSSITVEFVE